MRLRPLIRLTIARIVNPITSAIKGTAADVAGFAREISSSFTGGGDAMNAAQNIVNQQQKQGTAETAANTATKRLNPFDGQPPGYNYESLANLTPADTYLGADQTFSQGSKTSNIRPMSYGGACISKASPEL